MIRSLLRKLSSFFADPDTLDEKLLSAKDSLDETIISKRLALIEEKGKIAIAEEQRAFLASTISERGILDSPAFAPLPPISEDFPDRRVD